MSAAGTLYALQAAIANVKADLSSDGKEDSKSPADQKDAKDDQQLIAALDAAEKAITNQHAAGSMPTTLKEASSKARGVFAASRKAKA